jgi:hypothetical protein
LCDVDHDVAQKLDLMSTEESPARLKVKADPHRVMAWVDTAMGRRPVQLGLTGLLVLLLALLLGTRLWTRDTLLEGLKAGALAERNIKASRDFDYMPSDEKLEKERKDAVGKILPVFDYHSDQATVIVSRIRKAFSLMTGADAGPEEPRRGRSAPAEEGPPVPRADPDQLRSQFAAALQVEVSPTDFATLRKAKFSPEVRSILQVMAGSSMNQMVVSHRGVLTPFKGKPILVRHLVQGQLARAGEEKVTNLDRIKDLSRVKQDLKMQASVHTAKLNPALAKVVEGLALQLVDSNVAFNRAETSGRREAARTSVRLRPITVVKGQVIVREGDPITKEHINIVQAMQSWTAGGNVVQEIVGLGLFVLFVLGVVFRIARSQFKRFYRRPRDVVVMGVLLVALVGLAKGVVAVGGGVARGQDLPIFLYVIPLAAGAMLVRLLISAEAAVLFATVLSGLCGLLIDRSLTMTLFYLVTSLVGATGVAQVQSRSTILRAGLVAGLVGAALLVGMRLFQGQLAQVGSVYALLSAIAGGVLASFMTLALLPAMEWLFAFTTDVTLLELANLNHPLLRDLILRAPGTYHHSMVVGNLAETACESIGANGLLARVASYYHDIGKVKNAVYFAENFKPGDNPHNRLKPSMSALIIRSHVKDTVEMLREHGVPELVIDTATQHHGKTLIEFFYHKANEQKDEDEEVRDEDYRYPGPKPQSREAGVIMLADGVEAAARSLAEPSEDRLRAVVQRVINSKFTDGQLDHCDLTLRDLHLIAKSFLQVLRGIYHQRPTYPWQGAKEEKERKTRETGRLPTVEQLPKDGKARRDPTLKDQQARKGKKPDRAEEQTVKDAQQTKGKGEPTVKDKDKGKKGKKQDQKQDQTHQARDGKKSKQEGKAEVGDGKGGGGGAPQRQDPTGKRRKRQSEDLKKQGAESERTAADEAEPEGEGEGAADVDASNAPETPTEDSPDIKRLGLN